MDATITKRAGSLADHVSQELDALTVGHTRMIAWEAVTRWGADSYEIGTYGKKTTTKAQTFDKLTHA